MPSTTGFPTTPAPMPSVSVPKLQAGDRLTADEFLRRYEAMPDVKKAELIQGVVYMPSPVSNDEHGQQHFTLETWLGIYMYQTPGVDGADNTTVRLDDESVPQPDGLLRILPECGGRTRVVDGYLVGGAELHAEISASRASYDLHDKLDAYRHNGVQEYIVWRVLDRAIDWFQLQEGRYEPLRLDSDGIYRSRVFPGLWLDPAAMIARDFRRVLEVIQQGIASREHGEFVERLRKPR